MYVVGGEKRRSENGGKWSAKRREVLSMRNVQCSYWMRFTNINIFRKVAAAVRRRKRSLPDICYRENGKPNMYSYWSWKYNIEWKIIFFRSRSQFSEIIGVWRERGGEKGGRFDEILIMQQIKMSMLSLHSISMLNSVCFFNQLILL